MKPQSFKKIISLLLVICMLISVPVILPIRSSAASITTSGNYFFKVGATSALANGSRVTFKEAAFQKDGQTYIPVSAIEAVASTPLDGIETVNGISCVNIANMSTAFSGYYASLSNIGLIAVSTTQNFFESYTDDEQVELMKKFIFDNIGTDGKQQSSFSVSDMLSCNDNEDRFAHLHAEFSVRLLRDGKNLSEFAIRVMPTSSVIS